MTVNPDKKPTTTPHVSGPTTGQPAADKAADDKAADDKAAADKAAADKAAADDKAANRSKLFIVVGEVHEFASAAQAEKFLNQANAPTKYTILRGREVKSKQRVSLRG